MPLLLYNRLYILVGSSAKTPLTQKIIIPAVILFVVRLAGDIAVIRCLLLQMSELRQRAFCVENILRITVRIVPDRTSGMNIILG